MMATMQAHAYALSIEELFQYRFVNVSEADFPAGLSVAFSGSRVFVACRGHFILKALAGGALLQLHLLYPEWNSP